MRMRARSVLPLTAVLLLLAGLLLLWFRNRDCSLYRGGPLGAAQYRALAASTGWQTDERPVAPGVILRGLLHRPEQKAKPWVLFFGGNGPDLLRRSQDALDQLRGSHDIGLAVWAYRGYDGSDGTPSPTVFRSDARALYRYLQEDVCGRDSAVHVVGFSMGAEVALRLAADLQADGQPAASLTLLSSSLDDYCLLPRAWYRQWLLFPDRMEVVGLIDRLRGPIVIAHGSADGINPVEQARTVASTLGTRGQYVELPGTGHVATLFDSRVHHAVLRLLGEEP